MDLKQITVPTVTIFLILLLLVALLPKADSLKCYSCSELQNAVETDDDKCRDPFPGDESYLVQCGDMDQVKTGYADLDRTLGMVKGAKDHAAQAGGVLACQKIFTTALTWRGCGIHLDFGCRTVNGSAICSYACGTDSCNGSTTPLVSPLIWLVMLSYTVLIIMLYNLM